MTIKNKPLCIFSLISILLIMMGVFIIHTYAEVANDPKESGGVMVYSFDYNVFQEFIKSPSRETLEQTKNNTIVSVFTHSDSIEGDIKRKTINKEFVQVDVGSDGEMRIGNLPVYSSLIDFISRKERLEGFLNDNGIIGEIKDAVILDMPKMAVTVWLKLNQENYFITIDERYDDYFMREDKSQYVYRLYSYLEYCNKFGIKDGRLLINGKDITTGNYVKIHYSGAYIPLRTVMENLGAKVEWDTNKSVAILFCDDKKYIFEPDNISLIEEGATTNILMTPPGGAYYFCKIIEDRIIMNNYALQAVIRLMGAQINIDYDHLIVEIISKQ